MTKPTDFTSAILSPNPHRSGFQLVVVFPCFAKIFQKTTISNFDFCSLWKLSFVWPLRFSPSVIQHSHWNPTKKRFSTPAMRGPIPVHGFFCLCAGTFH